jgi:pyruvate dehydrogenase (quinone)
LMVGTSFPYLEFLPRPGQARAVQIELDPARVGLRYPVEVGLVGDSGRTLQALLPLLGRKSDRSFLERAQAGMKNWWTLMEERGSRRHADEAAGRGLGTRATPGARCDRRMR